MMHTNTGVGAGTDVRELDGVAMLAWLRTHDLVPFIDVEAATDRGLFDLDAIASVAPATLEALHDLPGDYPLTATTLARIDAIGVTVEIGAATTTVGEWWTAGHEIQAAGVQPDSHTNLPGWPATAAERHALLARFLAGGVEARTVRAICHAARTHGVPPDVYGTEAITAEAFTLLAENGVTAEAFGQYRKAGLDPGQAAAAVYDGIAPFLACRLIDDGIPRCDWPRYAPITFPVHCRLLNGRTDYSLDDILTLATSGVFDADTLPGEWPPRDHAMLLAEPGLPWRVAQRYEDELRKGNPPLMTWGEASRFAASMYETAIRMHAAGVKPAHLADFRLAGCHSPGDVLTAVAEGVTAARARALRHRHGRPVNRWARASAEMLADLDELLRWHRTDPDT